MSYSKSWETVIVSVGADPFTATFDREGCEEGIGYKIAFYIGRHAEAREDIPVAWAWGYDRAIGLIAQLRDKSHSFRHCAWGVKDLWMGYNSKEAAQNQVSQTIGMIRVDQPFKPTAIGRMVWGILPVGIHEHIDIKKNHEDVPSGQEGSPNRSNQCQGGVRVQKLS